jgi:hypothetical protein
MTIAEAREKSKSLLARIPRDILIISVLILASSASFGLGFLAGQDVGQGSESGVSAEGSLRGVSREEGKIVASKGGTKYFLPECTGAGRISEANKIWFASVAAAKAAGYSPAANCAGL